VNIQQPSLHARARIAGAIAAAVALAVGELVSAFGKSDQSLVGGVGNEVVDRAAGGLVRFAIEVFGTANKSVLVVAIVIISLLVGSWLGRLSLDRPWAGPVGFAAFGVIGMIAGVRDPLASDATVVIASVTSVVAGVAVLTILLRLARGATTPLATTQTIDMPSDDRASRRAFFGWAGATAAFAATAAVAARSLTGRSSVETARRAVELPPITSSGPALADGGALAAEGLTPYITPNDRFYRIDTALVVPQIDVDSWTLSVTGLVDRPFELSFEELIALSTNEEAVTLACVSNEIGGSLIGNARWQGVPLATLLDRAGVQPDGTQVVGKSVDNFTAGFPTEAAYDGRVSMVAVGMNGEPLPVRHGFPARLVVEGLYGYVSATKWLDEIRVTRWDDFDGYWIPRGWSKEGPVKTQSRIDVPRAGQDVMAGRTAIAGVAWAPSRGISQVEVQVDDDDWHTARLGDVLSDNTWVQWLLDWDATPGDHTIQVRATDGTGVTQTADRSSPAPDGASGWHRRQITVLDG